MPQILPIDAQEVHLIFKVSIRPVQKLRLGKPPRVVARSAADVLSR
jgi:hypothetical protein